MELFIVKSCALIRVRGYLYSLKCYTSSTHCSARIKVSLTQIIKFKLSCQLAKYPISYILGT